MSYKTKHYTVSLQVGTNAEGAPILTRQIVRALTRQGAKRAMLDVIGDLLDVHEASADELMQAGAAQQKVLDACAPEPAAPASKYLPGYAHADGYAEASA